LSGKKAKRNKRREKEAAREVARRKERQQTLATVVVIGIIVAIGGVLIWLSLDRPPDPLAEPDELEELDDPADDPLADRPVACGADAPAQAGEEKPTFDAPEQVLEDGVDYQAVVETSCGTVVLDLDAERAPETVNSFVFLAQQGFFDGLEIFRNASGIGALQTGSGTNSAAFSVGYTIDDELGWAEEDGYPPGAVAMANAGPDTAGSQFFFVYNELFDAAFAEQRAYARFATLVEGLDVLETIGDIPVEGETPTELVYMERVTIQTGDHTDTETPEADS
jgi:peptidyl-prolyl cis-trans isomerase B (cyclophilin B)